MFVMRPIAFTNMLLLLVVAMIAASGCTSSRGGKTRYPVAHAGVAHKMEMGTIASVREVVIDGRATTLGIAGGAAVGTAVGAVAAGPPKDFGDYQRTAVLGAVAGVAGAVVGKAIEKKMSEQKAQELTINLNSGETIIVVQPVRDPPFSDFEKVQVYTTAMGSSRVFHASEDPFTDPETSAYLIDEDASESVTETVESAIEDPVTW